MIGQSNYFGFGFPGYDTQMKTALMGRLHGDWSWLVIQGSLTVLTAFRRQTFLALHEPVFTLHVCEEEMSHIGKSRGRREFVLVIARNKSATAM